MTEMSPAEAIFFAALALPGAAERAAYLDEACAGQPELRARVDKLLAAQPRVGEFLQEEVAPAITASFAINHGGTTADYTQPQPGTLIAGRYKLLQQIGEGGMGTVWMADQTEPVKRRVAVKLIRAERGGSQTILARFEAERQAIALMDHPHIAKLLEAGKTEVGSPFFVMELVKGVPLTDYCDAHKLSIAERLQLFVQICSAVQHAHQKGIIHRDLKPSNILVESHDGKPVPKVIDFGLAKATSGLQLTEHTLFTGFGAVLGTPLYMAPEQAQFNAVDIDTRADVYALGVILYELLTGTTPLTRESMKRAALDEMLRLVREQEAPTPSSRLSSSDSLPSVSANRQTEPQKLGRLVRGELDWIALKALSKERDRRYETANGFAKDIERFLNHEPVQAGPTTAAYRIQKFVRRHRGQVIAATTVVFALLAGIAGTTTGIIAAKTQERRAIAAQLAEAERAEGERRANLEAQSANELTAARLRQIETINDAVFDIFAEFDIRKVKAEGKPVEAVLAQKLIEAGKKLDAKAIGDPLVLAKLRDRLGQTLISLGEASAAIDLLLPAVEYSKTALGDNHPQTLASMHNLAMGYQASGKFQMAIALYEKTLDRKNANFGNTHETTISTVNNLALCYQSVGDPEKSISLYEEAIRLSMAKNGPEQVGIISMMNNLGLGYQAAGNLEKALPLMEETLSLMKSKLGEKHSDTLSAMNNLAGAYRDSKRIESAIELFEATLKLDKAVRGPEHPKTIATMSNLAEAYQYANKLSLALPLSEEVLHLSRTKNGPDHPDTILCMNNLAGAYRAAGKTDKAVQLYEQTLLLITAKLGPDHPNTIITMGNLGRAYISAGLGEKAAFIFKQFIDAKSKDVKTDKQTLAKELAYVAGELLKCGQLSIAEKMLAESLAIRKSVQPDAWSTFSTQSLLGYALLLQKKLAEAEPLLLHGYEGMKARENSIPPQSRTRIPEALDRLIELYTATDKPAEVEKWRAERAKYEDRTPQKQAK